MCVFPLLRNFSRSSGRIVFDGRQHIPKLLGLAFQSGPESCFTKSVLSCPYAFVVLHLMFYDGVKNYRDFVRRGGGPRGGHGGDLGRGRDLPEGVVGGVGDVDVAGGVLGDALGGEQVRRRVVAHAISPVKPLVMG